jgi:hypothetical protein
MTEIRHHYTGSDDPGYFQDQNQYTNYGSQYHNLYSGQPSSARDQFLAFVQQGDPLPIPNSELDMRSNPSSEMQGSRATINEFHRATMYPFRHSSHPLYYAETGQAHLRLLDPSQGGLPIPTNSEAGFAEGSPSIPVTQHSQKPVTYTCEWCDPQVSFTSRGALRHHVSQKRHRASVCHRYRPPTTADGDYEHHDPVRIRTTSIGLPLTLTPVRLGTCRNRIVP